MAGTAHATFPGESGEIAYGRGVPSPSSTTPSIFAAFPNGQNERLLVTSGHYVNSIAYNAGGDLLAYSTSPRFGGSLLTVATADGEVAGTLPYDANAPAFSPDDDRIAFRHNGYRGDFPSGLYTAALDGSDRTPLGPFDAPDWSPDGATIVAENDDAFQDTTDLFAIPAAGGPSRRLTNTADSESGPSWSPDGRQIAYARSGGDGGTTEIWVMDADGSDQHALGEGIAPSWSPNGRKIAFVRDSAVWTMRVDGSSARKVVADGHAPAWRPADQAAPDFPGGVEPGPPEPPADNRRPRCRGVTPSPKRLSWRADGRLKRVRLRGGSDPDGNTFTTRVIWIAQDERVRGRGDRTAPDAAFTGNPAVVRLRDERARRGDGRVYWIGYRLTDRWGARCSGTTSVRVRRHRRKPALASPFYASSLAGPRA
jgi:Tol biopolymer transport system component